MSATYQAEDLALEVADLAPEVRAEILRFADEIERLDSGLADPDDFKRFRLENGVYGIRGAPDRHMIRVKVRFGEITPDQLETTADIADEFTERVVQRAQDVSVGDPLDPATKVGALISEKHLGVVSGYVDLGQQEGASVALGGDRLTSDRGRYYSPTVLAGVPKTARVAREEIFGPVLSVVKFADLAEAVEITNATGYGLSAGVWSRDIDTALGYARATKAGTVWINCYMDGFPEISFGGYGASGIGRELGRTAIDEYIEHKSTIIRTGAQAPSWVGGVGEK